MTYEPATLACLDGYAVAYLHRLDDKTIEIKGTFRARCSVTAIMIAAEGNIVYDGLMDDGETLKHIEVPVTVRSYGKVAAFESCDDPLVIEDLKRSRRG